MWRAERKVKLAGARHAPTDWICLPNPRPHPYPPVGASAWTFWSNHPRPFLPVGLVRVVPGRRPELNFDRFGIRA
jgi:hypothetical protein